MFTMIGEEKSNADCSEEKKWYVEAKSY